MTLGKGGVSIFVTVSPVSQNINDKINSELTLHQKPTTGSRDSFFNVAYLIQYIMTTHVSKLLKFQRSTLHIYTLFVRRQNALLT